MSEMKSNEEIEHYFSGLKNVAYVKVTGDGYHYNLTLVSDEFCGLSKVARQQWVYAKLKEDIAAGHVHAITMTTLTIKEWEKQHG